MMLHHPVIHELDGKKHLDVMPIQVAETSRSDAPLALEVRDVDMNIRLEYRSIEGRLYAPVGNPDGGRTTSKDLAIYQKAEDAISPRRLDTYSPSWGKRIYAHSPLFSFSDRTALVGSSGRLQRDKPQNPEYLARTPMGRTVSRIAERSRLVDGVLHRESVGPVLAPAWHADRLWLINGHYREWDAAAFSVHDAEGARRFAAAIGLETPELEIAVHLPHERYDPTERCMEVTAWMAYRDLDGMRIPTTDRETLELFVEIRRLLASSWEDVNVLDGPQLIWPYQAFDDRSNAAHELSGVLDRYRKITKSTKTRKIVDLALERISGRTTEMAPALADFSL